MTVAAADEEMCSCGLPLHYAHPASLEWMQKLVDELGPDVVMTLAGAGIWRVPRHYVALHGVRLVDLPELAERFGWPLVRRLDGSEDA